MKEIFNSAPMLVPVPVVLISSGNLEKANIATVAWTGIINTEPAMLYISLRESRYSHKIISKSKEFVVNIPSDNFAREVDFCGTKSGKNIDKFKECKFTKRISNVISAPAIKECPINIECIVKEQKNLGSHDIFISEIVSVSVDKSILTENNKIDYVKAKLLAYADGKYFSCNKVIAERGICLK